MDEGGNTPVLGLMEERKCRALVSAAWIESLTRSAKGMGEAEFQLGKDGGGDVGGGVGDEVEFERHICLLFWRTL